LSPVTQIKQILSLKYDDDTQIISFFQHHAATKSSVYVALDMLGKQAEQTSLVHTRMLHNVLQSHTQDITNLFSVP